MKKKGYKKKPKVHLVFDEKERADYLTGFQKRNLARKLKKKEILDKKLKEELKRIKHNHKEAFHQALTSQREVPEVQHLVEPVSYDLPDHTVTISQLDNTDSSGPSTSGNQFPLAAGKTQEEIEKLRKVIKELKNKRIRTLQKSNVQFEAKKLQKKNDKQKAKKMRKQFLRGLKNTKKKHKKKHTK